LDKTANLGLKQLNATWRGEMRFLTPFLDGKNFGWSRISSKISVVAFCRVRIILTFSYKLLAVPGIRFLAF